MKIFALAATALLATVAYATPTPVEVRNSKAVVCTFFAGPTSFTQRFPTDGSVQPITNNLSVSQIQCPPGATCIFEGINGSSTTVSGNLVTVMTPQTQVSGSCNPA